MMNTFQTSDIMSCEKLISLCYALIPQSLLYFLCFAVHEMLGLKGSNFQSLYHFTVGGPVLDKRIMSLPAYPGPNVDA